MKKNTLALGASIVITSLIMVGCVVEPAPVHYHPPVVYPEVAPAPVIVNVPPPAPQVEVVGTPPVPGYFWVGGVWIWEGGRHVWHPGHWQQPKPGYTWVPHYWHPVGNQWYQEGGHWQRN